MNRTLPLFVTCLALAVAGCLGSPKPKTEAQPTRGGATLPGAVARANTNAAAALDASQSLAADAAASVAALADANTNQPAGVVTDFIGDEARIALALLPAPSHAAALAAEQRRAATFAGQRDEARRLHVESLNAAAAAKAAAADAARRAAESAAALVAAEREHAAAMERSRAENQAKLDAALKAAADAQEKAKAETHKTIFRALLGLGLACIAGAIALAVITSGAMVGKSLMLAGGGALCIALAQIVAHPWFDRVFGCGLALAALGGAAWLWFERKDAAAKEAARIIVRTADEQHAMQSPAGLPTPLAVALSRKMDAKHKAAVKSLRQPSVVARLRGT